MTMLVMIEFQLQDSWKSTWTIVLTL